MSGGVEVRTRGFTRMKTFASAVKDIPIGAFPVIVEEMRDIGVAAGKASIKRTTGNKKFRNTGDLYNSFTGIVHIINKEHSRVEIGSDLDYAEHTAIDTGPINERRRVQVAPHPVRWGSNAPTGGYVPQGWWMFIGIRPRIAGHPYMQETEEKVMNELDNTIQRVLNTGWQGAVNKGQGAPPTP